MRAMPYGVNHDDVPAHVTEPHQHRRAAGVAEGRRAVARAPADDRSLEDLRDLLARAKSRFPRALVRFARSLDGSRLNGFTRPVSAVPAVLRRTRLVRGVRGRDNRGGAFYRG